jgi:PhnB protein
MVKFLKRTFAATGDYHRSRPAELRIGDSMLMVSSDAPRGAMPTCLYVYVHDVDATYQRALEAGGSSIEAPTEMPYGDRRCVVEDAWGNLWQIATRARAASSTRRGQPATKSPTVQRGRKRIRL